MQFHLLLCFSFGRTTRPPSACTEHCSRGHPLLQYRIPTLSRRPPRPDHLTICPPTLILPRTRQLTIIFSKSLYMTLENIHLNILILCRDVFVVLLHSGAMLGVVFALMVLLGGCNGDWVRKMEVWLLYEGRRFCVMLQDGDYLRFWFMLKYWMLWHFWRLHHELWLFSLSYYIFSKILNFVTVLFSNFEHRCFI